uniref:Uncharacterized protein n=1 Tax=Arundo donax TaxID=35708 RepID=A0A0A9FY50_ARUDO
MIPYNIFSSWHYKTVLSRI